MTITQVITPLPAAPNPLTDTPAVFSEKAAASVAAQQGLPPEINAWRIQANALEANVNAKELAAGTAKAGAETARDAALGHKNAAQLAADAAESYPTQSKSWADAAAASANTVGTMTAFSDQNPVVKGSADNTKKVRIEVDTLATGQTRTWTAQDRDGTVAFLGDTGKVLVWPPVNPTAVAFIDLLFTAAYDNYKIVLDSVSHSGATTETLQCRFLVAGASDATVKYASVQSGTVGSGVPAYATAGFLSTSAASIASFSNSGMSGTICVFGANETVRPKIAIADLLYINGGGPLDARGNSVQYVGTTAVTGIRLFWGAGTALFNASGKIRLYGWKNA